MNDFDSIYGQVVQTIRGRLEARGLSPVAFENERIASSCFIAIPRTTLLAIEANEEFVLSAYFKILDVLPDPDELANAVKRVAAGLPREQLIDELLADPRLLVVPTFVAEA